MQKIVETVSAGIVAGAIALSGVAHAQSQQPPVKNIVLVHGAFADGTSWAKVIPILEARGFHAVAVQNPLTSLSDDVNATRRIIAMQDGAVILVGHSWGGAVISEVGDDPKVAGLVYVAAYAPDVGMSANDTSNPFGPTPGQKAIQVDAQHFAWMSEEGILNSFADGLPMPERRLVLAVQGQIYGPMFDEKLTHAAWKSKPSWHVIATKDHTLSPAMEEAGAKKAGGVAISIPTCHVAMLQEPQKVADLIMEAASGSTKATADHAAR
ncbi:MAG: alpha/beta hydrolase [Deltaproteobacteria bacterium]|nr:alpha/beta hydrolase [Deltaproteobacteria bacterium]